MYSTTHARTHILCIHSHTYVFFRFHSSRVGSSGWYDNYLPHALQTTKIRNATFIFRFISISLCRSHFSLSFVSIYIFNEVNLRVILLFFLLLLLFLPLFFFLNFFLLHSLFPSFLIPMININGRHICSSNERDEIIARLARLESQKKCVPHKVMQS